MVACLLYAPHIILYTTEQNRKHIVVIYEVFRWINRVEKLSREKCSPIWAFTNVICLDRQKKLICTSSLKTVEHELLAAVLFLYDVMNKLLTHSLFTEKKRQYFRLDCTLCHKTLILSHCWVSSWSNLKSNVYQNYYETEP